MSHKIPPTITDPIADGLRAENKVMRQKIVSLVDSNVVYRKELKGLKADINKLTADNNELRRKADAMRSALSRSRRLHVKLMKDFETELKSRVRDELRARGVAYGKGD